MTRHEILYDPNTRLDSIAVDLERHGAKIYHINKDKRVIGADIPQEKLDEIKGLAGITLTSDPLPIH